MKVMRLLTAMFASLLLTAGLAAAAGNPGEKRVALVIGNSEYEFAVTLPNPVNDARLMAATLRGAGFEVIEGLDLDKAELSEVTDRFTESAYDADVAVIYYAGHGLQVDGKNYIIPVDAELTSPAHLRTRAQEVDALLASLPPDPSVGIIILDACRDNPLSRRLAAALPASRSQSMGQGLAPVQANLSSHGAGGVLIAYATDPGAVALDGDGTHSPYTAALARHIAIPGVEIQSALTRVRGEVADETGGQQRPWHNASLGREVFIGGKIEVAAVPPVAPQGGAAPASGGADAAWEAEQRFWDEAARRDTPAYYQAYLDQYPNGRFVAIARLNVQGAGNAPGMAAAANPPAGGGQAQGTAVRTAPAISAEQLAEAGTPASEKALGLDKAGRIDLQLRLRALGYDVGRIDGDIGQRSRNAIAAWQQGNSLAATTFLTGAQHAYLVSQSDPMMAGVRAEYADSQQRVTTTRSAAGNQGGGGRNGLGIRDREAGAFAAGVAVGVIGTAIGGGLLGR